MVRTKHAIIAVIVILGFLLGMLVYVFINRSGQDSVVTTSENPTFTSGDTFSYGVEVYEKNEDRDMRALLISRLEARGPIIEDEPVTVPEPEPQPVIVPAPVTPIMTEATITSQNNVQKSTTTATTTAQNNTDTTEE